MIAPAIISISLHPSMSDRHFEGDVATALRSTPQIPHARPVKVVWNSNPVSGNKIGRPARTVPFEHEMPDVFGQAAFENFKFSAFNIQRSPSPSRELKPLKCA